MLLFIVFNPLPETEKAHNSLDFLLCLPVVLIIGFLK